MLTRTQLLLDLTHSQRNNKKLFIGLKKRNFLTFKESWTTFKAFYTSLFSLTLKCKFSVKTKRRIWIQIQVIISDPDPDLENWNPFIHNQFMYSIHSINLFIPFIQSIHLLFSDYSISLIVCTFYVNQGICSFLAPQYCTYLTICIPVL